MDKAAIQVSPDWEGMACPKCPMTFAQTIQLKAHMDKVHTNDTLPDLASAEFEVRPSMADILGEGEDEVSVEGPGDSDQDILTERKQESCPGPPLRCPHCPKTFAIPSALKLHLEQHKGGRVETSECDLCHDFVFSLAKHKARAHRAPAAKHSSKVECPLCPKMLTQVWLKRHLLAHTCDICQAVVKDMTSHMATDHAQARPPKRRAAKEAPKQDESAEDEVLPTCDECGIVFNAMMGTGKRLSRCPKCEEHFFFSHAHLASKLGKRVPKGPNPVMHPCPRCHKEYSALSGLRAHVRKEHKNELQHCLKSLVSSPKTDQAGAAAVGSELVRPAQGAQAELPAHPETLERRSDWP